MQLGAYMRITKRKWYALGGFRNSSLFRRANNRGAWRYYMRLD